MEICQDGLFQKSACVEMPAHLFNSALGLAAIENIELENHEYHPSVQALCEWWNENAPNTEYRCAGAFEIFCYQDQVELVAALKEAPSIGLSMFAECDMQQNIARVGDCILILFLKPLSQCEDYNNYHHWNRVDGDCWVKVNGPIRDSDNAYWAWKSMQEFQRNFPEIAHEVKQLERG